MKDKEIGGQYEQVHGVIQQAGIVVTHKQHRFSVLNQNLVSPHLFIVYCHQGSSRVKYDMRETSFGKNELAVIMPEHVLNQLECSDDFVFTRIVISAEMFAEMRSQGFKHDYDQFHLSPTCRLTDVQAEQLMKIIDLLDDIANFNAIDQQIRRHLLLAQMSVGFELIHYHFHELVQQKRTSPYAELFNRFCNLVVEHYRESREVQFYADQLHLTPKHFSKVIRQETGGISPADWIEQYVTAQAKRLIANNPHNTFGEIAYMLGFSEPTSFYRYFKRVSGTTAKQYRDSLINK